LLLEGVYAMEAGEYSFAGRERDKEGVGIIGRENLRSGHHLMKFILAALKERSTPRSR
jgi:hypothetical protein